jgi:hypothetical protein
MYIEILGFLRAKAPPIAGIIPNTAQYIANDSPDPSIAAAQETIKLKKVQNIKKTRPKIVTVILKVVALDLAGSFAYDRGSVMASLTITIA